VVATKDEVENCSKTKRLAEIMPFRVLYTLFTNSIRSIVYFLHPQLREFRPSSPFPLAYVRCSSVVVELSTLANTFPTCTCVKLLCTLSRMKVHFIHQKVKRVIFGIEGLEIHLLVPKQKVK
jgi:hypothetical protein